MTMTPFRFRRVSMAIAVLLLVLSMAWLFAPAAMLASWGIGFDAATGVVSRRSAALFGGLATMFWLARNADASIARSALVGGFVVATLTLAALGIFELARGQASTNILVAVLIELAFPLALLHAVRTDARRSTQPTMGLAP